MEFAKFYITEADRAYVSVDGSTLAALSGPTCEGCKVTLDGVAALKNAGEHQTKPSISVQATNVLPGGSQDGMEVQVLTKDMAVDVVDKNGKTTSATEAGTTTYRIYVTWTGAGWIASDMAIDA